MGTVKTVLRLIGLLAGVVTCLFGALFCVGVFMSEDLQSGEIIIFVIVGAVVVFIGRCLIVACGQVWYDEYVRPRIKKMSGK